MMRMQVHSDNKLWGIDGSMKDYLSSETARWRLLSLQLANPDVPLGSLTLDHISVQLEGTEVGHHTMAEYSGLHKQFLERYQEPDAYVKLSSCYDPRMIGTLGYLMLSQETGLKALEVWQLYGRLTSSFDTVYVEHGASDIVVRLSVKEKSARAVGDTILRVVHTYRLLKALFGEDALLFSLLPFPEPDQKSGFNGFFRNGVAYDALLPAFVLDRERVKEPLPGADRILSASLTTMGNILCNSLQRDSAAIELATLLQSKPDALSETAPKIANELGLSFRTLQRRLEAENTSYAQVLDEVRKERALALLLCTNSPILDVAENLGYNDISSFYRVFRGWFGTTPVRFKQRLLIKRTNYATIAN